MTKFTKKFTITLQVSNMAGELPFQNLTDYKLNFKKNKNKLENFIRNTTFPSSQTGINCNYYNKESLNTLLKNSKYDLTLLQLN